MRWPDLFGRRVRAARRAELAAEIDAALAKRRDRRPSLSARSLKGAETRRRARYARDPLLHEMVHL